MEADSARGTQKTIVVGYDGTAPAEHALRLLPRPRKPVTTGSSRHGPTGQDN